MPGRSSTGLIGQTIRLDNPVVGTVVSTILSGICAIDSSSEQVALMLCLPAARQASGAAAQTLSGTLIFNGVAVTAVNQSYPAVVAYQCCITAVAFFVPNDITAGLNGQIAYRFDASVDANPITLNGRNTLAVLGYGT